MVLFPLSGNNLCLKFFGSGNTGRRHQTGVWGSKKNPTARAAGSGQEDVQSSGEEGKPCPGRAWGSGAVEWVHAPSSLGAGLPRQLWLGSVGRGAPSWAQASDTPRLWWLSPPWPARVARRGPKTYKRAALRMPAASFQAEKYYSVKMHFCGRPRKLLHVLMMLS